MPEFVKAIGAARFGVMAGVAAALTAFFLYVAGALSEPPKTILFSGLDPRDASAVTAKLDAMNVKYDAKGDGGTILVPADEVTKLRMELAADNLPAAGVGYEIFDKSDAFGTTAFVQNINRLRAMEGELARSIQTIEGIDCARIHLVIPERQIFSRDDQAPSASVVLKTRGVLGRGQVQAIQHLVAAACRWPDARTRRHRRRQGQSAGRRRRQERTRRHALSARNSTPPISKTGCASASNPSWQASSAPAMSASRSPPT